MMERHSRLCFPASVLLYDMCNFPRFVSLSPVSLCFVSLSVWFWRRHFEFSNKVIVLQKTRTYIIGFVNPWP
jgi:hypothetical protein